MFSIIALTLLISFFFVCVNSRPQGFFLEVITYSLRVRTQDSAIETIKQHLKTSAIIDSVTDFHQITKINQVVAVLCN